MKSNLAQELPEPQGEVVQFPKNYRRCGEDYVQATKVNWLEVFDSIVERAAQRINGGEYE
ncbi:hypothetical protein C9E89_021730 [Acinetobacter sichuanensis]|uniref:Uncharacterized protein n=1 Tax=Acinetobacter sichuanensis TaxID=2136183 RepID=A0A371YJ27_9GAMM|nr:hypothetical protein C9E89_021730 [Acinetobacter sichuanensis]